MTRFVIFGTADLSALADFERWADRAGGCMAARPTAEVDEGDRYTWMDYVLSLALQRVPDCPLRATTWSDLASVASLLPFDGPHYGVLTPNLFQASVDAIDTMLWNREKLCGGTALQPPRPADASPPPAERPENEARAPAPVTQSPAKPAWPKSLDSRAVGVAHEMLQRDGSVNVAEVARRLRVERTKLYRQCPAFKALVDRDRASREAAKSHRPRGWKDGDTGTLEGCAADD
jgi:hypothetical protein